MRIAADHPDRVFLLSEAGAVTYGDLLAASQLDRGGRQVVVEPGDGPETVVDLVTVPGEERQLVVVDPRLPDAEKERRVEAARAAAARDAATIVFTSGTTGPAKGVRLTHRNWEAALAASAEHLGHRPEDVWLAAMPLHHVGGLSILLRSAYVGAQVRWLPRFVTAQVVEALRSGVTIASFVPTMLRRILDHDAGRYSDLRAVLVGGGPIPDGLLEEAHGRGIPALPTYGMTETCAQVATLRPGSPPRHAAHPLPGIEIRIGKGDRIELRGPQVSPGYADQEDRPVDAWFRTPDRGALDPDGALRVFGRADQVIVTGGENVDPNRVEAVLCTHPRVHMAVVVGVPDPEWGERVVAVYEGSANPEELAAWARERLSGFEVPRSLRHLGEIPTNGAGKPDRPRIRAGFAGPH